MRHTTLFLVLPAVLSLAACGQSRKDVADEANRTTSTYGSMATDGAMGTDATMGTDGTTMPNSQGMMPPPGAMTPSTDPMANPVIPGADLNTGPGNDGFAGTTPIGVNETPPVK